MDRHLTLETVWLSEAAALYARRDMGQGDDKPIFLKAEKECYESK